MKKVEIEIYETAKGELPNKDNIVNALIVNCFNHPVWIDAVYYHGEWVDTDNDPFVRGEITHWCELPQI